MISHGTVPEDCTGIEFSPCVDEMSTFICTMSSDLIKTIKDFRRLPEVLTKRISSAREVHTFDIELLARERSERDMLRSVQSRIVIYILYIEREYVCHFYPSTLIYSNNPSRRWSINLKLPLERFVYV